MNDMFQTYPPEQFLKDLYDTALAAADPYEAVMRYLPTPVMGKTLVVGAGKASARMAQAVEEGWGGEIEGLVVVPYGHKLETKWIEVVEAAHPIPDEAGVDAANRIYEMAESLSEFDQLIVLLSGGGSSLLSRPMDGLRLSEKQIITGGLLQSGARISEINTVRKHLSSIKGGKLAQAAWPAKVITLIVSDVPGDDPSMIASGPTLPNDSSPKDALKILEKYGIPLPPGIAQRLEAQEDVGQDFIPGEVDIIVSAADAFEAAARLAHAEGIDVQYLGDDVEGEARSIALAHANLAMSVPKWERPKLILSGGEATVSVKGNGLGGRNQEYALALAIGLNGASGVYALAADTDGIDGLTPVAGAFIHPDIMKQAQDKNIDARAMMHNNDSFSFFKDLGGHITTGPTSTNVNDFRAILVI